MSSSWYRMRPIVRHRLLCAIQCDAELRHMFLVEAHSANDVESLYYQTAPDGRARLLRYTKLPIRAASDGSELNRTALSSSSSPSHALDDDAERMEFDMPMHSSFDRMSSTGGDSGASQGAVWFERFDRLSAAFSEFVATSGDPLSFPDDALLAVLRDPTALDEAVAVPRFVATLAARFTDETGSHHATLDERLAIMFDLASHSIDASAAMALLLACGALLVRAGESHPPIVQMVDRYLGVLVGPFPSQHIVFLGASDAQRAAESIAATITNSPPVRLRWWGANTDAVDVRAQWWGNAAARRAATSVCLGLCR